MNISRLGNSTFIIGNSTNYNDTNYTNYTNYNDTNYTNYNDTDTGYKEYDKNYYLIFFSPCICICGCLLCFAIFNNIRLFILDNIDNIKNKRKKINPVNKTKLSNEKDMDLNNICCICLVDLNEMDIEKETNIVLKTKCNHTFHRDCIKHNSIINCPICRDPLKFESYCIINKIKI